MAEQKAKRERFTTPKGTFRYPHLTTPDYGTEDYPQPNGQYNVQLLVKADSEDAKKLIDLLTPFQDAAIAEGEKKFGALKPEQKRKLKELRVNELYTEEFDGDEPTGNIIFKFSTTASGENDKGEKWSRTIPIFDAKGKPFKPESIGGGTVGKVSFEVGTYFIGGTGTAGVKLYLAGVQVIDLRQYTQASADSFGFGEEEGFSADEDSSGNSDFGNEETSDNADF